MSQPPLHYFPFFAADWLSSPAVLGMRPEQEGAFIHLLAIAWGNGIAEPSLPADDDELAGLSRLGRNWPKLGKKVRAQFTKRGGRLYNAKLSEVWRESQERHSQAVKRGKAGASKRWKNYGRTIDQPLDEPMLEQWQPDPEGTLEGPTAPSSSPPPSALAPEGPRSGEVRQMDDSGTVASPETAREVVDSVLEQLNPTRFKLLRGKSA